MLVHPLAVPAPSNCLHPLHTLLRAWQLAGQQHLCSYQRNALGQPSLGLPTQLARQQAYPKLTPKEWEVAGAVREHDPWPLLAASATPLLIGGGGATAQAAAAAASATQAAVAAAGTQAAAAGWAAARAAASWAEATPLAVSAVAAPAAVRAQAAAAPVMAALAAAIWSMAAVTEALHPGDVAQRTAWKLVRASASAAYIAALVAARVAASTVVHVCVQRASGALRGDSGTSVHSVANMAVTGAATWLEATVCRRLGCSVCVAPSNFAAVAAAVVAVAYTIPGTWARANALLLRLLGREDWGYAGRALRLMVQPATGGGGAWGAIEAVQAGVLFEVLREHSRSR